MSIWKIIGLVLGVGFIYYVIVPSCKWLYYYTTLIKKDGVDKYQVAIEKGVAYGLLGYKDRLIRIKVFVKTKPGLSDVLHSIWTLYDYGSAMFDETIKAANTDPELVECNYIYTDKGEFGRI